MVAKEHPEVIEGGQWLIAVYVLDSQDTPEYYSINNYVAASDEDYGSGLLRKRCYRRGGRYAQVRKKTSILPYMLKPSHLLTQGFENNKTAK